MRTVVLVDGEHYPPVTRWGIETAMHRGRDVVGALFMGGIEKIDPGRLPDVGVPSRAAGEDRMAGLAAAIDTWAPEVVLDLSDEPVLGYRERMELAAVALTEGLRYVGADFEIVPPIDGPPITAPTLAVIGTGKRTGKTAISGEVARLASRRGHDPVIVAMGRGGPSEPQVAEAGTVHLEHLVRLVRAGNHAASDYLEDALTTGVTTIGARRAGVGSRGRRTRRTSGLRQSLPRRAHPGSWCSREAGRPSPPCPGTRASWWCRPVLLPSTWVATSGPYRLLRSDLVVVTMAAGPLAGPGNLSALRSHVLRFRMRRSCW